MSTDRRVYAENCSSRPMCLAHLSLLIFCLTFSVSAESEEQRSLHLYGGENSTVYLGCLNCTNSHPESIWNKRGKFGRVSSDTSIWNKHQPFGSANSNFSPWDKRAAHPPIILDVNGEIYGRFTLNRDKEPTNIQWAAWVLSNYETIRQDLDTYRANFADDNVAVE